MPPATSSVARDAGTSDPTPRIEMATASRQLANEGWCIVPDVLDAAGAALALERLHAAAVETGREGLPTYMPELDPNASNIRVFYLLERDAIFRRLIQHSDAVALVESLLGPSFTISNFTANIARPGARSMPLHSDQALVVPAPWLQPWAINIIWCLTDVSFENGATLFIPGSNLWRSDTDAPANARSLLKPFEARAGSIIAMDGRVWHTSGANITADRDRALLFGYYAKAFLRPQVNWNAALSDATKASLGVDMRNWLGLGITANASEAVTLLNARRKIEGTTEGGSMEPTA